MTELRCGVRARVFPLLCAVALLVPDLIAARVTSGAIDVVHYDVEVKPDFDQRTITGRTTIRFRSLESSLSEVSFSPNAMSIDEARMNGTALRVVRATDSIAVQLSRPVLRGQRAEITLSYSGKPARGLTFEGRAVYSSYFTCDWMICSQDDPGDKATLQMSLLLPNDMMSWGPGTLRSRAAVAGGLERQVWREDRPFSSYLFGFAAGEFQHTTEKHGQTELTYLSTDCNARAVRPVVCANGFDAAVLRAEGGCLVSAAAVRSAARRRLGRAGGDRTSLCWETTFSHRC